MTHVYRQYVTACICGQVAEHHDHTGMAETCPCSNCELDRETARLQRRWDEIVRRICDQLSVPRRTPYEDVPATFKPAEALL